MDDSSWILSSFDLDSLLVIHHLGAGGEVKQGGLRIIVWRCAMRVSIIYDAGATVVGTVRAPTSSYHGRSSPSRLRVLHFQGAPEGVSSNPSTSTPPHKNPGRHCIQQLTISPARIRTPECVAGSGARLKEGCAPGADPFPIGSPADLKSRPLATMGRRRIAGVITSRRGIIMAWASVGLAPLVSPHLLQDTSSVCLFPHPQSSWILPGSWGLLVS